MFRDLVGLALTVTPHYLLVFSRVSQFHFIAMQKSAVIALALLESVSAFQAPALRASTKAVQATMVNEELGINPGPFFFDPLGVVADGDQERFDKLRYVEIKHGRICQLAFLHWVLIGNGITLPGMLSSSQNVAFSDVGQGWAGSFDVPAAGALQILAFVGFLELFVMKDSANGAAPGDFPGDFRNGYIDFGWDKLSAEEQASKRGIELNNGRAAMMGVLGLAIHEQLGVSPWIGFPEYLFQ